MAHTVDQHTSSTAPACPAPPSGRRFLRAGLGSGFLGGICCLGSAVAIGASIGGLSFFSTWMERYQLWFIVTSVLVMALWLGHQIRRYVRGGGPGAWRAFLRRTWRQLLVMGAVYVATLGLAAAVVAAVGM